MANRRKEEIKIITIDSKEAYNSGVSFYKEENNIWLSESIPSIFIQL